MPNLVSLEEKVETCINEINTLHSAVSRTNWAEINRQGFVFELEQNTARVKNIYSAFEEINREIKMLLEKNSPDYNTFLSEIAREITVLEANVSMEKKKKLKQELVNETEPIEVPELYSSLQQKILTISLKMRYNIDKARTFLIARRTPFVQKGSTAKGLLEALQQKEDELNELKQKNVELKRKTYFGNINEKTIAETEIELNELDKKLSTAVEETKKSMKTHFAQISYVEGSFTQLKKEIEEIENNHAVFAQKSVELIKELKKERDYARTLALEIEQETIHKRSEYTKELVSFEEKKNSIEERMKNRYEKEFSEMKKHLEEKTLALKNAQKIIEQLEEEKKSKK
jgi:hypothetical protein